MCADGHEEEEQNQEAKKRAEPTFWRGCKGGGVSCFAKCSFPYGASLLGQVLEADPRCVITYGICLGRLHKDDVKLHDPSTWNFIRDSTAKASFARSFGCEASKGRVW